MESLLLHEIALGSEDAFAGLFQQYKDKVYAIAFRMTESQVIAEDITQDVFLRIWLRRESLKEVNSFRSYLYTATRNHVYNALKKMALQEKLDKEWESSINMSEILADANITGKEYSQFIEQAIQQLPERQQNVYQLISIDGYKREEVATLLRISPETVKQHLAQARRSVRAFLLSSLLQDGTLLVCLLLTSVQGAR